MTFEEKLLAQDSQQDRIDAFLADILNHNRLRPFTLGVPPGFPCVVLGIAAGWSDDEVRLLDRFLAGNPSMELHVFDITQAGSQAMLEETFPGIGPVYQTPVFACFSRERMEFVLTGFGARQKISEFIP